MFLYRFFKRSFDILSSLIALTVTLPFWIVIVLGIKLSSKGPVFYNTERAGVGRKPFTLHKFRSMHVYHSDGTNNATEGGFLANKDRIFPFGAFLRKSKLDELPQLLNILAGDMSVVGPRPLSVKGAEVHYADQFECVMRIRPGLTCLDSLFDYAHGELFVSSNEEYKQKVLPVRNELARLYVEKQSIRVDTYCIFRTMKLMVQIALQKKKEFPYTKYEAEAEKRAFGPDAG